MCLFALKLESMCRPKIVEGRLAKIRSQKALLEQPYIKDTGSTVAEHIKSAVASLGENIQVCAATTWVSPAATPTDVPTLCLCTRPNMWLLEVDVF